MKRRKYLEKKTYRIKYLEIEKKIFVLSDTARKYCQWGKRSKAERKKRNDKQKEGDYNVEWEKENKKVTGRLTGVGNKESVKGTQIQL